MTIKDREKPLRTALSSLKVATTLIHSNASGVEPFRASKILNVIGKELTLIEIELSVLLGDISFDEREIESIYGQIKLCSLPLLKAMKHDGEI